MNTYLSLERQGPETNAEYVTSCYRRPGVGKGQTLSLGEVGTWKGDIHINPELGKISPSM